ncbi:hypothetical protein BB561_005171 [Smittium simulii]|uniref:Uncharacterized protein n=1 Tax=Smittium simulii TaxID=133385 RepID=A0A2T9YBS2_9FUNG|nr:hypothetical protein BB561_005171 [Smittium simulii]
MPHDPSKELSYVFKSLRRIYAHSGLQETPDLYQDTALSSIISHVKINMSSSAFRQPMILGETKELCTINTHLVYYKLLKLGFKVTKKKSLTSLFNESNILVYYSSQGKCSKSLKAGQVTLRCLASFIEKALLISVALLSGQLMLRRLLEFKNYSLLNSKSWASKTPKVKVFTNARNISWGVVVGSRFYSGTTEPSRRPKQADCLNQIVSISRDIYGTKLYTRLPQRGPVCLPPEQENGNIF